MHSSVDALSVLHHTYRDLGDRHELTSGGRILLKS